MYSMTAFARQQKEEKWGSLSWEIRSVNHRYLDVSLRLPETLSVLEDELRGVLRNKLHRGKVDGVFKVAWHPTETEKMTIDEPMADQLKNLVIQLNQRFTHEVETLPVDLVNIMRWPGVVQTPDIDMDKVKPSVIDLLNISLDDLIAARHREGVRLQDIIENKLVNLEQQLDIILSLLPETQATLKQRIQEKLQELVNNQGVTMDESRLEQELLYLAQKSDIAEELDRLSAHIQEVRRTVARQEPVGRRLDFLMQELNREANTLSSKSQSTQITQCSVEIKVLIEQMREQVQNIE